MIDCATVCGLTLVHSAAPPASLAPTYVQNISLGPTYSVGSAGNNTSSFETGHQMKIFIALLFLVLSGSASADYFTGNDLNQHLLNSGSTLGIAMFRGYVAGVQDTFNGVSFCVPSDVPLSQAAAVVRKYLSDNPKSWNKPADVLVFEALKQAYPCKP